MAMVSCVGTAPTKEVRLIDSLNQVAYSYRYKDLDSSCHAATRAYENVNLYRQGKAEASNNLGFCAFMRMDFEKAEKFHNEVYSLTKNELELLIADIGLMKIYQRTAMNKEFYDYRNSALRRMKRIDEDNNLFVDQHERLRLNYARTEFYIVSAVYYYYLQQRPEAVASINEIYPQEELVADTNQLLYYHYIKGSAALCEGETADERRLREFDELYTTWKLASRGGYLYFEGNGVQGLANLMASPDNYEFFQTRRSHALKQFEAPVDSLLPMRLGQLALKKFKQYNDLYQIAGAYVSIGKYLNAHGSYTEALDTLTLALECVNNHHRRFYDCHDSLDWLKTFDIRDTISSEKAWIQRKLRTVPEWISRIREQLSVTYAGLEMKQYSDYNRNIYLDILEDTRQDKELESRYLALESEARQLNILLFFVIVGFILVVLLFWIFNRRSKERNRVHLHRLRQMLDICQKITASIPADAQTEEEIVDAILSAVQTDMGDLFGIKDIRIEDGQLVLPKRLTKDDRAIVHVITPYITWALDNGMTSISLGDERRRLEKERYVYEQHIAGNKRQNLIKKACMAIVNGIHPYIDRIINEVHKLTEKGFIHDERIKAEKYQYMDELVTTINEYNDILALWIKMKQGSLSLNIETFGLNELFDLIRKGSRAFEMKQQQLEVTPTDAYVKADKALTLFMINTLAENARKYTPKGGNVKVYARPTEEYVEISVEDSGYGLSEEDVTRIIGEKLYNSQEIGMLDAADREELRKNKGSGFGLMNCKGIIEKYRKTNEVFKVCLFNVESTLGKGSRFYFRLPVGVRKTLIFLLCIFLPFGMSSCHKPVEEVIIQPDEVYAQTAQDSLSQAAENEYEILLNEASEYANEAYYSNVAGDFELTLEYADSAIACLNAHYKKYAHYPQRYMTLRGEGEPGELSWWNNLFNSDFHVILDIRNEAAVAFLALKQWDAYSYNNAAYTTLYKLLGEDQSLEEYCNQLERSTNNKMVGVILFVGLIGLLLLGYYILYIRKRLVNRWNLEQVLEINRQIFTASLTQVTETEEALQREEETLKAIPQRIVDEAFDAVNELLAIDRLGVAVYNEATHQLEYASNSIVENMLSETLENGSPTEDEGWKEVVQRCFDQNRQLSAPGFEALPLVVDAAGDSRCIGVLYIERQESVEQEAAHLLLELIARYIAIVVFNAVVKLATKYRDIEAAHEEAHRASWEDSLLHVQNMVLDNCLSTIKHETIYYPNKIKQLIGKLRSGTLSETGEKEIVSAIGELIEYYKGIFTILSSCASRQLEEVTFRRGTVAVTELCMLAEKYFRKASKGKTFTVSFHTEAIDERVVGDFIQLRFLLENLIDEALSVSLNGEIYLKTVTDGEYIRFLFTDTRREKTREELNRLFYPNLERMTSTGEKGELRGTEYLVCKQIIRDHDEFAGKRGCRINAELAEKSGFTVYFTIPRRK
ncbi:ATP-binding protein [Bacteroides stercorirosoris]|uniref:histidine kinase n=1 Tax=Bacteroides stercorirosoris TaxID=871324 RepID=A0A1M6FM58_9BACE|nr:DUF5113 domain-containing protein [Bacteroides stercorirosoris]SHI98746.1 Histidine kinase-, DNA gyrase B-, and HSP90-like ATPase [Bacteroides stercorirosoris]